MRLVPGRKYTFAELEQIRRENPDITKLAMQGYVWRQDMDGTMQLVHWSQASGGGGRFGKPAEKGYRQFTAQDPDPFRLDELPPIVRRTPQERLDSLMKKAGEDLRAYLSGRAGHEVAGEDAKEVAASSLNAAERQAK